MKKLFKIFFLLFTLSQLAFGSLIRPQVSPKLMSSDSLVVDERGTVVGFADEFSAVSERVYYNSTGLMKGFDASGNSCKNIYGYETYRSSIPFGWTGMYKDPFTGHYHTLFRDYDPITSRWLSEDPAGYADGLNLYGAYFGVNGRDPYGLLNEDGACTHWWKKWKEGILATRCTECKAELVGKKLSPIIMPNLGVNMKVNQQEFGEKFKEASEQHKQVAFFVAAPAMIGGLIVAAPAAASASTYVYSSAQSYGGYILYQGEKFGALWLRTSPQSFNIAEKLGQASIAYMTVDSGIQIYNNRQYIPEAIALTGGNPFGFLTPLFSKTTTSGATTSGATIDMASARTRTMSRWLGKPDFPHELPQTQRMLEIEGGVGPNVVRFNPVKNGPGIEGKFSNSLNKEMNFSLKSFTTENMGTGIKQIGKNYWKIKSEKLGETVLYVEVKSGISTSDLLTFIKNGNLGNNAYGDIFIKIIFKTKDSIIFIENGVIRVVRL